MDFRHNDEMAWNGGDKVEQKRAGDTAADWLREIDMQGTELGLFGIRIAGRPQVAESIVECTYSSWK